MLVAIPAQAGRFFDIPFQVHHIHVCLPKSNKPKKDIFLDFKSYQSCLIYFWHQFTIILIQEQISYERYRFKFCRNAYYLFNNAIQIQNRNSWKHIQLSSQTWFYQNQKFDHWDSKAISLYAHQLQWI